MGDDAEFDALYNELFGGDPAPVPKPKPARKLNALSTATCANCHGAMKMSMVGFIHTKSGNIYCYGIHRPDEVGVPVVDEENRQ
jgi:hypothetical protein